MIKKLSILFVITACILLSNSDAFAYDCDEYKIDIPEGYTTDSESIAGCTTFRNDTDNITILIRTENNIKGEDVSTYTESHINDIINDTISSLDTKGSSKAHSSEHAITSFSSEGYPALYISYEGSGESNASMYMEEYIITTSNYIYTLVFSSADRSALDNNSVDTIKAGFTAHDTMIIHSEPADNTDVLYLFIGLCALLLITGAFVIIHIIKSSKHQ